jgi:hypothetical protein
MRVALLFRLTRWRTCVPAGPTPILSYHYTHDRVFTLAALTVSPKRQHLGLYHRFPPKNCQAVDVADFRQALLDNCAAMSGASGTGAPFTREPPLRRCAQLIPGCTGKSS